MATNRTFGNMMNKKLGEKPKNALHLAITIINKEKEDEIKEKKEYKVKNNPYSKREV